MHRSFLFPTSGEESGRPPHFQGNEGVPYQGVARNWPESRRPGGDSLLSRIGEGK